MRCRRVALLVLASSSVVACEERSASPRVLVAASFQEAAERVLGDAALVVPAASSTLARQIVDGAPASCFISANREWMDFVATRHGLEPGSRQPLVRNRIVVVAPKGRPMTASLATLTGKIAMGDPGHVPAGEYGKRALQAEGVWRHVAAHVVPTSSVREALALVERDAVDLGVVYFTDAVSSDRVVIVHRFTADDRAPVVEYEIALTRGGDPALLRKLTSAAARRSYGALGFLPAPR